MPIRNPCCVLKLFFLFLLNRQKIQNDQISILVTRRKRKRQKGVKKERKKETKKFAKMTLTNNLQETIVAVELKSNFKTV
jgi:hypothetical protein